MRALPHPPWPPPLSRRGRYRCNPHPHLIDGVPGLEILLILGLILLNGVFAMSEIAVVSSRRARLAQRAAEGDSGARRALDLAENPNRFLSTVQIGITLVGVFAGAYGGASIAGQLAQRLEAITWIARYSEEISLAVVVASITFLSLVVGELVPKRIALNQPERIASLVSGPMHALSIAATPLVRILGASTEAILRLVGARKSDEPPVTEEEIASLLKVGTAAGVFEENESQLVERIFWLGDQSVSSLMTPRHRIRWLDLDDPPAVHREELKHHRFSHYLVGRGEIDEVVGMVRMKDLVARLLQGHDLDIEADLRQPLFVPEGLRALRLLEKFRETGIHLAVVIDEYGGVDGLVTLNDVLEEITGNLSVDDGPRAVRRADGSWLVDASLTIAEFRDAMGLPERREGDRGDYLTVAGLVVTHLGRIPRAGDTLRIDGMLIEVVDMDGHRVDKVIVSMREGETDPAAQPDR